MTQELKTNTQTIGEIVAADFRTAEIFKNAGIDFCCGGNVSIEKACNEQHIDSSTIIEKIEALQSNPINQSINYNNWDLGFLADFIKNNHHSYVEATLPQLVGYTEKIANVHGAHHPELIEIAAIVKNLDTELMKHLEKEEVVLFPAIKEFLQNKSEIAKSTIVSEITRMKDEHEVAGEAMHTIHALTQNYTIPIDACNTYSVTLKLLKQFEDDLHVHVHLENNILYPKALLLN